MKISFIPFNSLGHDYKIVNYLGFINDFDYVCGVCGLSRYVTIAERMQGGFIERNIPTCTEKIVDNLL